MGKSHRASFTMRFLGMSLLAVVLAATVQAEDFTKEKIQLGKKKCLCDFSLDVAEKCKGTAKCDKKCSGSGEVEIGGCSFTLVVKKGKGKISKCSCKTAPTLPPTETTTATGSGSGETPVPMTGSGSGETPVPITGSGSGPVPITGSGAPPAGGEGMQCSCKCDCPDGSGECDCDCNCPMTSKAVNCAPGFCKVCPMVGDACPQDMEPICPNNAMSRMAGGAGDGHMADKGCQCVPDFLMDMVKIQPLAPAGRRTAVDRAMTKATIQVGKKKCKCSYEMNAENCKKSKITCDKKCSGKASGVELEDGIYMLDIAVKKGKVTIAKCDVQAAPAPTGTGGGSGGMGSGSASGNGGGGMGGIGSRCACVSMGMGGTGPVPPPGSGTVPTGSGSGTVPTGSGSGPAPTGSGSGPVTLLPPTGSGSGSDVCPEERPGFGSACRLPEMTCDYGKQTCCGESIAEYQMECRAGEWNGYYIDTVCMDASHVCANTTREPSCICPAVFSPVCGADGQTYSNTCTAACGGSKVACEGECPCTSCSCIEIFAPVCGADGETYSNSCKAACAGSEVACQGDCPCQ